MATDDDYLTDPLLWPIGPFRPRGTVPTLNNERRRGEEERIAAVTRRIKAIHATKLVDETINAHHQPPRGGKYKVPKERPPKIRTVKELRDYLRSKYGNFEKKIPPRSNTLRPGEAAGLRNLRANRGLERLGATLRYGRDITLGTGGFQPLIDEAATQLGDRFGDYLLRGQRLRRLSTAGPRRAAATRAFQPSAAGLTNRTGAGATRAADRVAGGAAATRGRAATVASTIPARASATATRAASSSAGATTSASATRNQVVTQNALTQLQQNAQSSLDAVLERFTKAVRTPPRTIPRSAVRLAPRTAAVVTPTAAVLPPSLTSLNPTRVASLVGSQVATKKCDCPKPKKEEKKSFSCSNPLVSRYVKDGIIYIKRKLQCPPSKPKSP